MTIWNVEPQLGSAKRQLDFAMRKKITKSFLFMVLGREGILKGKSYIFFFKRYENAKFYDADYQKYRYGGQQKYTFFQNTPWFIRCLPFEIIDA